MEPQPKRSNVNPLLATLAFLVPDGMPTEDDFLSLADLLEKHPDARLNQKNQSALISLLRGEELVEIGDLDDLDEQSEGETG